VSRMKVGMYGILMYDSSVVSKGKVRYWCPLARWNKEKVKKQAV